MQCMEFTQLQFESHKNYETKRLVYAVLILITEIIGPAYKFDGHNNPSHALNYYKPEIYHFYQEHDASNTNY